MLPNGKKIRSPGGSFVYQVSGPVCVLYDREELPWPSCSLRWKGKQPSWNRIGKRFIPDIAASRCASYAVEGVDAAGNRWHQVLTLYSERLPRHERGWWYWRYKPNQEPPNYVEI